MLVAALQGVLLLLLLLAVWATAAGVSDNAGGIHLDRRSGWAGPPRFPLRTAGG
ncbi:hypothetical protein ACH4XT_11545 [Streptomyces avidinii]|uniref:hypothetical protein n=1 Tax=Streptomyces avidinii TaxID=1895 RepID=UPI0037962CD6